MTDSGLQYTFTCPSCSGSFSILLERIPPVQARFKCPHCKKPMDFPSREEARVYAKLQSHTPPAAASREMASPTAAATSPRESPPPRSAAAPRETVDESSGGPSNNSQFRVEKPGFETDLFDRRGIRNLIRTSEIDERDQISVDGGKAVAAIDLPYLKSLFSLRKTAKGTPPACCRSHTDRVAHFRCKDTSRPLCEECAPEKKFGGTTIRVCNHCGGTAEELAVTA